MHFFDLESVDRGIDFSDNSKHFSNICSPLIVQKKTTKTKLPFHVRRRSALHRYAVRSIYSGLNDGEKG